ncbi:LysR family transcriptional regulator [Tsukamurella ocularis]|uniref:LysR family transcriptional regulator n=1 Tax=Tsukamurella ocularis TaxID=1970234 RepID=UPI0039F012FF
MGEIAQFRLVLAVARHGGIGAAARTIGANQPTVSRAVHDVEARLGRVLFDRTAIGTRVREGETEAIARLTRIVDDYDALVANERPTRSLTIGFAWAGLPPQLDRLLKLWEHRTGTAAELLQFEDPYQELVHHRRLDMVISRRSTRMHEKRGVGVLSLGTEPRVIALNTDHPLAGRNSLRLNDVCASSQLVINTRTGSVPTDLWGHYEREPITAPNSATWLAKIGAEADRYL